jgi:sugar-specific transcriptional regulator TrmB
MKKSILIIALITASFSWGQDVFEKYEYDDSVSYFSISPKMFQMLAKLSIETNDPEADKFLKLVEEIESFKVITTESKGIAEEIQTWVDRHIKSQNLDELLRVRDKGANVNFYVKSTKNDERVKKLLMFVSEINEDKINLGDRQPETVLLYLSGDIDLTQISKLVNEMNLPGGQQLGKLNEQ